MNLSNWQIAKKVGLSIISIQRYKSHIRDFLNRKTNAIQIVSKNRTNGIKNVNDATIKSFWKEIKVGDYSHEGYEK
ncbi:hypothetical protein [Mycoplasmopsis fermentans]|nr:hypothetical protein [Mycoplasmopsis fermentans]VEU67152.1 Uncharacterised protein [Mesomycoplasma conjunctivae]ADV34673.1 Hypothetical Protein MfeM64YM_0675 [Mycoplasmopsis fermentans M64]RMX35135.1 hypothetical protein MFI1_0560 [Mycoplasmopsis fermentans MF-I1]RMX35190.1 hypothetical protein MFI2_0542 [Mycoplasmopsis fermentans MF-I2]VEU63857.1 Uncharacterised protein [Mycoplasmopsis fermentans]